MRSGRRLCTGAALAALLGATAVARGAGEVAPGAYCPLPEPGKTRECLEPARGRYGGFFEGLESGEPSDEAVAQVEADLAQGGGERAYLALSTLAYGYYRLADLAAATPGEDPAIVARLKGWNALLARAYAGAEDPDYRRAVRSAAVDLSEHSRAVQVDCIDARGEPIECTSTEAVLRGLDQTSGEVGIRGSLQRILERLTGGDDDS